MNNIEAIVRKYR